MSFSTGSSSQSSEINVTPLIDVLLVLLIIFMVLVPMKQPGLTVQSPQPSKGTPELAREDTIVLQVHAGANGGPMSYAINQQPVAKSDVVARLKSIFVLRSQKVMFVKGDRDLEFNSIAEAIGMGREALVTDIGVLTPKMDKGE